MTGPIPDESAETSARFKDLLGARVSDENERPYWEIGQQRYPLIEGIPILLGNHRDYLHRLGEFLEMQLDKLQQFGEYPPDRFWVSTQTDELQKRLQAIRAVQAPYDQGESRQPAAIPSNPSKYDSEANTDIYTRIAWGYRSFATAEGNKTFPDAGDLYSYLAQLIESKLPANGVCLDLGCGVGRAVSEAARVAPNGLAIGLDLSFSKVARAQAIVSGKALTCYPVREKEGMVKAGIQGLEHNNTAFAVGDAAQLLFRNHSVDCVLLGLMIGLVSDPEGLIREIIRVLKPGGYLMIVDPFDAFYDYLYPWDHRLTESAVVELIKRVIPGANLEITGPVSYREHWAHSRTVIYDTTVITVKI
ncbi:MAG: class I SAM-dependent methyltransferase [Gammaproteobacteria bacterium]